MGKGANRRGGQGREGAAEHSREKRGAKSRGM